MKASLKGSAKTERKTNFGKSDFNIESDLYNIGDHKVPIIIENKVRHKYLVAENKESIKFDDASIKNYAVNGALYYAQNMISSGNYSEVIAIGVAGDNENNVDMAVFYVYGFGERSYKRLPDVKTFDFFRK